MARGRSKALDGYAYPPEHRPATALASLTLYCQRPPAFAHSSRWSTEQKPSGIRCSPRWRIEHQVGLLQLGAAVGARPWCVSVPDGSSGSPASQCAPCIAHGTTCSRRQKTAPRSPACSASRKPSVDVDRVAAPRALWSAGSLRSMRPRDRFRAMPDRPRIIVLEGDQTGQELLEQALRLLDPAVCGVAARARALRPLAREPPPHPERGRARRGRARCARPATASRRRRSRPRARTTSAAPTRSCARRSTAR